MADISNCVCQNPFKFSENDYYDYYTCSVPLSAPPIHDITSDPGIKNVSIAISSQQNKPVACKLMIQRYQYFDAEQQCKPIDIT